VWRERREFVKPFGYLGEEKSKNKDSGREAQEQVVFLKRIDFGIGMPWVRVVQQIDWLRASAAATLVSFEDVNKCPEFGSAVLVQLVSPQPIYRPSQQRDPEICPFWNPPTFQIKVGHRTCTVLDPPSIILIHQSVNNPSSTPSRLISCITANNVMRITDCHQGFCTRSKRIKAKPDLTATVPRSGKLQDTLRYPLVHPQRLGTQWQKTLIQANTPPALSR